MQQTRTQRSARCLINMVIVKRSCSFERRRLLSPRFILNRKNNKGQLKIQEMAFVLLALVVLGGIVFLFTIRLQSNKLSEEVGSLGQQRALSLRDKIAALPEIKCARGACIDEDKVRIIQNYDLEDLFPGVSGARIVQIYPTDKEIVLYKTGRPANASYSTFVNLCQQKQIGTTFEYDCGLAMLLLSI